MPTNRLEAFSDGVFAVAITLLVLGISVPDPRAQPHHSLIYELGQRWPEYAAYAVSFITIGIIWINHHAMISRLARAEHSILILNLLLLMTIGILPFATDLMATYLRQSSGQKLAAGIYGGAFLLMAVAFATLHRHIMLTKSHLMSPQLPLDERRRILSRSLAGLVPYAVSVAVAPFSAYLTLAICAVLGIFYATPLASGAGSPA